MHFQRVSCLDNYVLGNTCKIELHDIDMFYLLDKLIYHHETMVYDPKKCLQLSKLCTGAFHTLSIKYTNYSSLPSYLVYYGHKRSDREYDQGMYIEYDQ